METLQRTANRGSISTGYDIDNSLKLEDDNSEGLTKNYSGDGDRRTWTYSTWIKRTELSQDYYCLFFAAYSGIQIMSENWLRVALYDGTTTRYADTNQLFRDTSAWYHIVVTLDSTDSTASDRVKIWINGSRVTDFRTSTYASMSQNDQFQIGQASDNYQFGYYFAGGANDRRFCGYVAETHYVNGTALEANDFGEYDSDSGIWIPKEYTGSHGSKGFYFKFDDSSNLGKDSSSGGIGDFSLSNISAADQARDTPTNNFSVMNPLHNYYNEVSRFTVSEGGTSVTGNQSGTLWRGIPSTFAASNGKWYWEIERGYNGNGLLVGVGSADTGQTEWAQLTSIAAPSTKAKMMYSYNGGIYGYNSSTDAWQYGGNFNAIGDVQSFAIDLDNGYMYVRHNGAAWIGSGDPSSGSNGTGAIALPWYNSESTVFIVTVPNNVQDCRVNFGGYTTTANTLSYSDANNFGAFKYAVPTGYYALCTKNLAEYG